MTETGKVPLLLQYMFGEAAGMAHQVAPERLLRWCRAFEDWLAELQRQGHPTVCKTSRYTWKQFLPHCAKAPWEVTQADVKAYLKWLETQGYVPHTIRNRYSALSKFFQWCAGHGIDPQCGPDFNPLAGLPRPKVQFYQSPKVLNRDEVRALLDIFKREGSILSMRDYAFFLTRLRIGVAHQRLLALQWGQIETDEAGARIDWGKGKQRTPLSQDAYQAVLHYLQVSGRLENLRPEAYIFAPLADPLRQEATGEAHEWNDRRHVALPTMTFHLKKFGRLAGIPDEKLTMLALRNTAAKLRQESGDSTEEIRAFLDTPSHKFTRDYLRALPHPAAGEPGPQTEAKEPPDLPERKPPHFKMLHGYYKKSQPAEEVEAILAEDIHGLDEEIVGLRILSRELRDMQLRAQTSADLFLLTEAYTLAASRLAEMIKAERKLAEERSAGDQRVEEFQAIQAKLEREHPKEIAAQARGEPREPEAPELGEASRRLTEEIASTRLVLRRTLSLAVESQDMQERVRLAGIYGASCMRLVRLLKAQGGEGSGEEAELNREIEQALKDIAVELDLKI